MPTKTVRFGFFLLALLFALSRKEALFRVINAVTRKLAARIIGVGPPSHLDIAHHEVLVQGEGPSLATSIYIPERHPGEDKLPTVLIRTPYWRALLEGVAQRIAEQGFNVIVQDVRGRYGSSGPPKDASR
jgi:predicted acyl esterase